MTNHKKVPNKASRTKPEPTNNWFRLKRTNMLYPPEIWFCQAGLYQLLKNKGGSGGNIPTCDSAERIWEGFWIQVVQYYGPWYGERQVLWFQLDHCLIQAEYLTWFSESSSSIMSQNVLVMVLRKESMKIYAGNL